MEHTEYYQLSLWEQDDRIQMEDFNSNNAKIDAALAGGAKIATGSYTGTGEYGSSHKNTLTFDFDPKLVVIMCSQDTGIRMMWIPGINAACSNIRDCYSYAVDISYENHTLRWYSNYNIDELAPSRQLNENHRAYYWIAIG